MHANRKNLSRTMNALALASIGITGPAALAKPPLQAVDLSQAVHILPERIAPLVLVDGELVRGEWVEYDQFAPRAATFCGWDAFGRDWGPGSSAAPIYGDLCGLLGPDWRWYFGTGYHAPNMADDVSLVSQPGAAIDEFNFAFTWENSGVCEIEVRLSNDRRCSPTKTYYGGFVASFGFLPATTVFYTMSTPGFSVPLPSGGSDGTSGSYAIRMMDGTGGLAPGPTQPVLWGTKMRFAAPYNTAPYVEGCGLNDDVTFLDDNPTNGLYDAGECYTMLFGGFPNPLNVMAAFGIRNPPCPPCPLTMVSKWYKIRGNGNNTPWSWALAETPNGFPLSAHGSNPGVLGDACAMANAVASELNAYSAAHLCPSNAISALAPPGLCSSTVAMLLVRAQVCPGSSFELLTSTGTNPTTWCIVPTNGLPPCVFNPEIVEIPLSGQDCNGNGEDDAIDIAIEDSADVNNNGIPDECECPGDFNHDGFVTGDDFDQYVAAFGAGDPDADFNADGFVTGDDFDAFVVAFEAGC